MREDIPEIILKSKQEEWLNVLFVNSPIISMISRMMIDSYCLESKNILLISFRNTDTKILGLNSININYQRNERLLDKLLYTSIKGNQILKEIKKYKKNFLLFASSSFREVNWLLKNNNCKGHIYIEEGRAAYTKWNLYDINKLSLTDKLIMNWRNKMYKTEGDGFFYRNDAKAFIGISKDSFAFANSNIRFLLSNFDDLKKYYIPYHLNIVNIGLTCADNKIEEKNWIKMFETLADAMGYIGVIKLHPSFYSVISKRDKIIKAFKSLNFRNIELSPNGSILELEMIYEKKKLFGPRSSLKRYANVFKSKYIDTNFS